MGKINWISSLDRNNVNTLKALEEKMKSYYQNNHKYYEDIDDSGANWKSETNPAYSKIVALARQKHKILEVGCGSSNILKYYPELETSYTGVDFSPQLMEINRRKFPGANFVNITQSDILPVETGKYDLVFSVFVLEHVVFPGKFLDECKRVLKSNGTLVILCPDYLGRNWMASQRLGLSGGTGREKLAKGKILDALLTTFDTRVKVPIACSSYRARTKKDPQFWVNIDPICFYDDFRPDVDAVYVTYKEEIMHYLQKDFTWETNESLHQFCQERRLIFLQGTKK